MIPEKAEVRPDRVVLPAPETNDDPPERRLRRSSSSLLIVPLLLWMLLLSWSLRLLPDERLRSMALARTYILYPPPPPSVGMVGVYHYFFLSQLSLTLIPRHCSQEETFVG